MAALGLMVTTFALESEDLGVESYIMRDWNKAKAKLVIIALLQLFWHIFLKANKQFALFHSNNNNDQWSFF